MKRRVLLTTLLLFAPAFAAGCKEVMPKKNEADVALSLEDFIALNQPLGWKVISIPVSRGSEEVVICEKGELEGLKHGQEVTLMYSWVVLETKVLQPATTATLCFEYDSDHYGYSRFYAPTGARESSSIRISKKKGTKNPGIGGWNGVVTAKPDEAKMVVHVQQIVKAYSGNNLIALGYLDSFAVALFCRKSQ